MPDFGGSIKFRLPDGRNFAVRGDVTVMPGRNSFEKVVNHDGTISRSVKPEGYGFSLAVEHRAINGERIDYDALMGLSGVEFTLMHDTEKVDRTFLGASLLDRQTINTMNGEVTGITGVSERYIELPR